MSSLGSRRHWNVPKKLLQTLQASITAGPLHWTRTPDIQARPPHQSGDTLSRWQSTTSKSKYDVDDDLPYLVAFSAEDVGGARLWRRGGGCWRSAPPPYRPYIVVLDVPKARFRPRIFCNGGPAEPALTPGPQAPRARNGQPAEPASPKSRTASLARTTGTSLATPNSRFADDAPRKVDFQRQ